MRKTQAKKPIPPVPLYLRIVLIDTDTLRENHKEFGPYWEATSENLRAIQACIEDLEATRENECSHIPAIRLVPKPHIINEVDVDDLTRLKAEIAAVA